MQSSAATFAQSWSLLVRGTRTLLPANIDPYQISVAAVLTGWVRVSPRLGPPTRAMRQNRLLVSIVRLRDSVSSQQLHILVNITLPYVCKNSREEVV